MRLNTLKPAPGREAPAPARRPRRLRRPGQDLRPRRQGPARAQGRLPQGRLRRRPDADPAPHAEGRLPLGHEGARAPRCAWMSSPRSRRAVIDLAALIKAQVVSAGDRARQGGALGRAQEGRDAQGRRGHQGRARGDRSRRRQDRGLIGQAMATTVSNTASFGDVARSGEIRSRLLFLHRRADRLPHRHLHSGAGHQPGRSGALLQRPSNTILGIVNMFSGGALSRLSIFAMGVMPYISASIIIQMMSMVVPTLMELRKEGESGRRKITQLHPLRHGGAGAVPVLRRRRRAGQGRHDADPRLAVHAHRDRHHDHRHHVPDVARRADHRARHRQRHLDDHPLGHRRRPAGRRRAHHRVGEQRRNAGPVRDAAAAGSCSATTYFVVYVERAQRRIPVDYAKRQVGRRMYAGQSSHLPFKLNMSGVIPPIFASSLLLFPATHRQLLRHRRRPAPFSTVCRTSPPRSATASRCTW